MDQQDKRNEIGKFVSIASNILKDFIYQAGNEEGIKTILLRQDINIVSQLFQMSRNAIHKCQEHLDYLKAHRGMDYYRTEDNQNRIITHTGESNEAVLLKVQQIFTVVNSVFSNFQKQLRDHKTKQQDIAVDTLKLVEKQYGRPISQWMMDELKEEIKHYSEGLFDNDSEGDETEDKSVARLLYIFKTTEWSLIESTLYKVANEKADFLLTHNYDKCFETDSVS